MKDGSSSDKVADKIVVISDRTSYDDLWEKRHETFSDAAESLDIADHLNGVERDFIKGVVLHSIQYMVDNIDTWFSDGLSLNDAGDRLTVQFEILVTDIDDNTTAVNLYTEDRAKRTMAEIDELGEEIEAVNSEG